MKCYLPCFCLLLLCFSATSQTSITAVTTSSSTATTTLTYTDNGNTYNWGVSPNNTIASLTDFTANSVSYTYAPSLTGTVKLRRVNNPNNAGNISLVWVEAASTATTFNMFPDYQNDMETFLNNHIYNKGCDNLLDNQSGNSNDIERFDWILNSAYSTPVPASVGFPVFDRGNSGGHDPFCIAAITSLDVSGNPASYSNIVRITAANYGDPGPSVTYRVLRAIVPANLLSISTTTQSRGGVFITLQDLGIAANTPIYGYSIIANDLPVAATPANLVDFTNTTYFPLNTQASGSIDMVAISGIAIATSVLPTRFISFNAVENNNIVNLKWAVENETSLNRYEIERSVNGYDFTTIDKVNTAGNTTGGSNYSFADNVASVSSNQLYYRVKQYDADGSYYYSKTISVRRNKISSLILYPNPAGKVLYITIPSRLADKGEMNVINSLGAKVLSQKIQLSTGNNSLTVDGIASLPSGIYQLSVKLNSGLTIVKQFSKQ